MHDPPGQETRGRAQSARADPIVDLERAIEHAARLLPSQGPITVFVHHNTLHAFEDLRFDVAVEEAAATYGCHPYRPEDFYRAEVARGRITPEDISAALMDDLGEDGDFLVGFTGTRHHLRMAMLEHPLRSGTDAELRWLTAETDTLRRFRDEVKPEARRRLIDQTRRWILRGDPGGSGAERSGDGVAALLAPFGTSGIERWSDRTWESVTLHLLWRICRHGVRGVRQYGEAPPPPVRHRELLLSATGRDTDLEVHEVLIRFCAAFLDQGLAVWPLPGRDAGFFRSFARLYRHARPIAPWLSGLPAELARVERAGLSPLESIRESLDLLGVAEGEREDYLARTLLALRGWAGMLRQMETNADWAPRPAPPGTLREYLAVRLILERLALGRAAREALPRWCDLRDLRSALRGRLSHTPRVSPYQRAYLVFQLAQVRAWGPAELARVSKPVWSRLVQELESFGGPERRRVYHLAYERRYRSQAFDALLAHAQVVGPSGGATARSDARGADRSPAFQVVCCLDEREESFRRHLEEVDPDCETFGAAGFFGVAMYYRGVADARFRPLCPVNLKPRHFVQEEPAYPFEGATRVQAVVRRRIGRMSHRVHLDTRGFAGGIATGLLGSLASVPLLMRVLLPRRTARLRRVLGRILTPPVTRLRLERAGGEPGPDGGQLGYSTAEMADVVAGTLLSIGLAPPFAPLVVVVGHGSSSLNNPHEAAYDCGACGGAPGGPNARAFAQMANDPRVRRVLAARGLVIAGEVHVLGASHNTCDDGVAYYDLDRLPSSHRGVFDRAKAGIEAARGRNARERCRRFRSAGLRLTPGGALRHAEGRAEDLSQARPEYGHSTNALCVVGRRSRTRGLFMDRRAFLASYDPSRDDPEGSTLAGLLRAVVPVCAGISLEYYFSSTDPAGYGCGPKQPHNIASLLGVMDGAASDLRPGLNWQMVEIHEPMRLLFVVETSPAVMAAVVDREPAIGRLVRNAWVQLATLDPGGPTIHVYRDGGFEPYTRGASELSLAPSSLAWHRGRRDHLGFASIGPGGGRD